MTALMTPVDWPSALSDYGRLWKSYYLRVNGLKTRFIAAGEGEPLVLLHGSAPGASVWEGGRARVTLVCPGRRRGSALPRCAFTPHSRP